MFGDNYGRFEGDIGSSIVTLNVFAAVFSVSGILDLSFNDYDELFASFRIYFK